MFQLTLWSIPPFIATLLALFALVRTRNKLHVPGGRALRLLFVAVFCWCLAQTLETLLTDLQAKTMAKQFAYLGIALTPVAWFQFALTYSQRVLVMSARVRRVIAFVPFVTLMLALTNPWHQLIWIDLTLQTSQGYVGLVTTNGLWFYVNAMYAYVLILIATSILAFSLTQFQQHTQAMLAAISAPLFGVMANIYSISPFNMAPWMDFTTLGFLLGVIVLDRGILQQGLLNRIPVVRDRVVEQLTDPVLVITHQGLIIDANQSALAAWASDDNDLLDTPIDALLTHQPLSALRSSDTNREVTIGKAIFEIAATPLDATNPDADVALVFRDVTERLRAEREQREMKDKLERMAHTDALTNLFNRRYFMQRLGEEFERVSRHNSVLSVLIFDLDHFKRINDSYGHDIGDEVLVAVSNVLNQVKRITDVACRLGGEEFALLLPETQKDGALQLAQRLRREIEGFPYSDLVHPGLSVTASVGVATVTQRSRAPEGILKVADRALYKAKNGGRNMVCYEDV